MRRGVYSFDAYRVVLGRPALPGDLRLLDADRRSAPSSSASCSSCRPPTGSGCGCRGCGRSSSSSRCCRWSSRRSSSSSAISASTTRSSLPAADRQRRGHRRPADLRLRHAGAALHVPRGRYRPARHRRAHADRGGAEPRRRLADHPVPGDPAQRPASRCCRGAFLTFAIVIGEFTMASLLNRPAFGPYLQLIGANRAYEPAALAIIAFVDHLGLHGPDPAVSRASRSDTSTARTRGDHGRWPSSSIDNVQQDLRHQHGRPGLRPRRSSAASSSRSSAPRAAARPRRCAWSPASRRRPPARSSSTARTSRGCSPNQRNIGMVFQAYALFPNMTVAENVAFGLKVAERAGRPRSTQRVEEMLRADQAAAARRPLSLPALRRPAAARGAGPRAGAVKPQVLLLDEPLSALDAKIRVSLREEIRSIQQRARHHHDLRDARPGRGAVDVRPHRGDERRPGRAGRHAVRDLQPPAHPLRRLLRRHAQHPARPG